MQKKQCTCTRGAKRTSTAAAPFPLAPSPPKPGVAVLQDLESLRELLGEDVVHGRDVLSELGVDATVHRTHVEQALGGPEVDLLADGLVLLGAPFEVPEAFFFGGGGRAGSGKDLLGTTARAGGWFERISSLRMYLGEIVHVGRKRRIAVGLERERAERCVDLRFRGRNTRNTRLEYWDG